MVCPYSLDVPGGVQAHVVGLAAALTALGHRVSVLAPADEATPVPEFVTSTGRAIGVPYNGSVARVMFGPLSYARARRWLAEHEFDVLHLHEPTTMSLSALTLFAAEGPIVATFHTSTERSRALNAFGGLIRPLMEKVTARIAVSPPARRVQVEHLGGDAVEIPNGVDVARYAHGPLLPGYPRPPTVGFVGRFDEPRKGMSVLLDALGALAPARPGLRLLVVGRGDVEAHAPRGRTGGRPARRARRRRRADEGGGAALGRGVLRAQHRWRELRHGADRGDGRGRTGAGRDLGAFRAVLDGAGALFATGDAGALAAELAALLDDPARRTALAAAGRARAAEFDWPVVAASVQRVYAAAVAADPRPQPRDVLRAPPLSRSRGPRPGERATDSGR